MKRFTQISTTYDKGDGPTTITYVVAKNPKQSKAAAARNKRYEADLLAYGDACATGQAKVVSITSEDVE